MKDVAEQTIIQIGTSLGITLPASRLKKQGAKKGSRIRYWYEVIPETPKDNTLDEEYAAFTAQYGETLKNLAQR
jgi:antitoxin component of MazEF toxin-antitoxin module